MDRHTQTLAFIIWSSEWFDCGKSWYSTHHKCNCQSNLSYVITRNEDITLHMHVIKMKNTTEKTMSSTVKQKKNKLMEVRWMKCSNRKSRNEERASWMEESGGEESLELLEITSSEAHWVVTCEDKSCRSLFMSISSFNKHFITSQVAKNLYVVLHKGKMFVSLVVGGWRLLVAVKWNWLQRGLCKKPLLATVLANYQSNRLPVVFVKDTKSSKETVTSETQTRNRKYSPSK